MNIDLIILAITFFIIASLFFVKYLNLKKEISKLFDVGTGRKGFYFYDHGFSFRCIIYVREIDRYNNGYSKIELTDIEPIPQNDYTVIKYAKQNFITLKTTSSIEWLEGESCVKINRKQKLDKIKKSLKFF